MPQPRSEETARVPVTEKAAEKKPEPTEQEKASEQFLKDKEELEALSGSEREKKRAELKKRDAKQAKVALKEDDTTADPTHIPVG